MQNQQLVVFNWMNLLILFLSILAYYIKYGVILDLYWTGCANDKLSGWMQFLEDAKDYSRQKYFDSMIEEDIDV